MSSKASYDTNLLANSQAFKIENLKEKGT